MDSDIENDVVLILEYYGYTIINRTILESPIGRSVAFLIGW